jgi:protein AFG1
MSGSGASTRLIRRWLARNHPTPPSSSLSFKSFSTFRSELASSPQSLAMPSPTTPSLLAIDVRTLATEAVVESGPTHAYNDQVSTGLIQNDDHQRSIVVQLQTMYDQLEGYTPAPLPEIRSTVPKYGFFGSFFSTTSTADPAIDSSVPKGLYLFGSVGCGKSFLMDLFYANLPAKFNGSKRRIHFHAFMMDVHQRGHRLKMEVGDKSDWIVPIARELASEARVLCFDEFQVSVVRVRRSSMICPLLTAEVYEQVTDIADAMILRRLMDALMGYGVVAVMTSKYRLFINHQFRIG